MKRMFYTRHTGRFILLIAGILFMVNSLGCEALVRKFTRKSKQEKPEEPMVLAPEEYKAPEMPKDEKYRHYFFYWSSWIDEFINSLHTNGNKKKQMDTADQALKNLRAIQILLIPDKQKALEAYIKRLIDLAAEVKSDTYNTDTVDQRSRAEMLKTDVHRHFSYPVVKGALL